MKLSNLMDAADYRITMMLSGIDEKGNEIGYDFKNKAWLDNNLFSTNRLITVGEFKSSKFYRSLKDSRLEDFSTFGTFHVKVFKDVETFRGTVLKVKVFTCTEKSTIMKAIDARVEKLAEKRMKNPQRKPKKDYRRKYNKNYNTPKKIKEEPCEIEKKIKRLDKEFEEDFYQSQVLGIPLK